MMDEEHEYCRNCKRQIARSNYVIHSIHCERNIQICELCSETIPCSDLQDHMEKDHSVDTCPSCSMPVEKWMIEKHKETCPKQAILCDFCDLEYPLDGLEEHVTICGARTEKCEACNKYVMLRDLKSHSETCNKYEQCKFCRTSFPALEYVMHLEDCPEHPYECELCLEIILYKNKSKHEATECRAIHDDQFDGYEKSSKSEGSYAAAVEDFENRAMVHLEKEFDWCPYCKNKIPADRLLKHKTFCEIKKKICIFCNKSIPIAQEELHLIECIGKISSDTSDRKKLESNVKQDKFQGYLEKEFELCPYCSNKIPVARFGKHKTHCSTKEKLCAFCKEIISIAGEGQHLIKCVERIIEDMPVWKKRTDSKDYPQETLESCNYCSKKISVNQFQKHKTYCLAMKKICAFCKGIIPVAEEELHLIECANKIIKDTLDENLCKMCSGTTINAVFLDCGHMATCIQCSQMFQNCPVCRQTIVRVVRVFKS